MKEYIEREAALSKLRNHYPKPDDMIASVVTIPAADVVEMRHGRWIKVHDDVCYWLACSVCGEKIPKRYGTDYYTNYCPNCGAKMCGGVEEEE